MPGRRLAAAGGTVAVALGLWCSVAQADYPVVDATIYPGSSGSVSNRQVSASALQNCPPYSGPTTMYMSPSGIDETVPSSSWALSTVVTCGLQLPLGNVSEVQVENPSRGFESPLSSADLGTPSPYQDPSAQPVISTDGSQNQNTYTRPWLGGGDENGPDQVVASNAPVTIVVYQNGSVLTVHGQGHVVSSTTTAMKVDFSATVQNAQGTVVPASALSWSWSFGDTGSSATAAPSHVYSSPGDYYVSVQVTDARDGSGGTSSFEVTAPTPIAGGPHHRRGAGDNARTKSPAGPTHTSGAHAGAPAGPSRQSGTAPTGHPGPRPPSPTPAPSSAATAAPSVPHHTAPARRANHAAVPRGDGRPPARRPTPQPRPAARARPSGRLVAGRLISDVIPLSAADSPLVRSVPAAAASASPVRRATQTSSVTGVAGGVVIALLLALGAARELRGSRAWRIHQP